MSAFSDTLSQYISDKNVKVYSMAKYCDTDRSSMYKFISGKRNPPSDEIIKKNGPVYASHTTGMAKIKRKLGYRQNRRRCVL